MELGWQIFAGLLPSVGVGWLFYKIMKALIEADRNERQEQAKWHREAQAASAGAGNTTDQ